MNKILSIFLKDNTYTLIKLFIALIMSLIAGILIINLEVRNFGLTLLLCILPIVFIHPKMYFMGFLLIRPLLDINFIRNINVNLGSLFTVFLIIICGLDLLKKENLSKIKNIYFLKTANKLYFFYLLFVLFSFVFSNNILVSTLDYLRLLSIMVAFNCAGVYFTDDQQKNLLLKVIIASSILPFFFGVYQLITKQGGQYTPGFNRIFGTFIHPNVFAQFLILIFFILLYTILVKKLNKLQKSIAVAYLFITVLFLYSTFSRGPWIAFITALGFFFSIKNKFSVKIFFLILSLLMLMLILPHVKIRFEELQSTSYYGISSWEWRLRLWRMSIKGLFNHPFLGNGLGMYESHMSVMAHNDYLRIIYETGFLGLLLYLVFFSHILFQTLKRLYKEKNFVNITVNKIVFSLIFCLLIMSFADNLARSTVIIIFYLVFVTFLSSNLNNSRSYE